MAIGAALLVSGDGFGERFGRVEGAARGLLLRQLDRIAFRARDATPADAQLKAEGAAVVRAKHVNNGVFGRGTAGGLQVFLQGRLVIRADHRRWVDALDLVEEFAAQE